MRATTLTLFDQAFLAQAITPATSVTPALFNPARWYDAASLGADWGFINGANILTAQPWDDQSVNDDDAASTVGHEPSYQTNVINGKPTVRFVNSKRMLFEGGDLVMADFTILCVLLSASDSNYVSRGGFNRQIRTNRSNEHRASWNVGLSGQELVSNLFLSNANAARMVGHRRLGTDIASPVRNFRFFDNLTEVEPTTGGVNDALFGINQIGTIIEEFSTPLNIDIAELVIYDTALTNEEIRLLYNSYFKPKFALP